MKTLRILVFHWRDIRNPEAGGAEKVLFDFLKEMTKLGIKIIVISPKFAGCKSEEIVDGIRIIRLGHKYSVYVYAVLFYILHLKKKIDLVLDNITGVPWFTPLYIKKPKVAIIYHLGRKETFFTEFPTMAGRIGYVLATISWIAEKTIPILYKNVSFITLSKDTKRDLVRLGLSEEQIHVVQEGIDFSTYKPGNEKSIFPHIIYVGRLIKAKGVGTLIKSIDMVTKLIPNVKLSIVGRGYFENELRKLTKKLNLEEKVIFHGYISEEEKIKLLQKAHILVMSSLREGWATPVIEANACGTPAIGTDVIGVKSTIKDGVTGLLFPYGDIKKLADKIIYLVANNKLRKQMSENAVQWASNFSRKRMIMNFIDFIAKYA
jgi:glycosyltransferase involved in cell wall biosynthesis